MQQQQAHLHAAVAAAAQQQARAGSYGAGGSGSAWGVAAAAAYAAGPAPAAGASQAVGGGSSRWTSMDGSVDGTPPGGRGLASVATEDAADIPNPADWDPLWSDDVLGEEEGGAERQQQRQAGAASPGTSSKPTADGLPARSDGPGVSSSREPAGAGDQSPLREILLFPWICCLVPPPHACRPGPAWGRRTARHRAREGHLPPTRSPWPRSTWGSCRACSRSSGSSSTNSSSSSSQAMGARLVLPT